MNKLIVICSGDQLGKSTLIKGLCEHYNYKNITIRHCDKPPKDLISNESFDFQFKCFEQEFQLIDFVSHINNKYCYHDNIIIYDRFYLGEYVYGQLFRKEDLKQIKNKILYLENQYLRNNLYLDVYLIMLTSDPEFFLNKEDGQSFSKNLEQKTKELALFKEAGEFSTIKNKLLMKIDKWGEFRDKQEILDEAISFLDNTRTILEYYQIKDMKNLQKVKAIQDESGHWYVIPNELSKTFYKDMEDEDFLDSGDFDNKYEEYRTGGDLNLVQLFAEL